MILQCRVHRSEQQGQSGEALLAVDHLEDSAGELVRRLVQRDDRPQEVRPIGFDQILEEVLPLPLLPRVLALVRGNAIHDVAFSAEQGVDRVLVR